MKEVFWSVVHLAHMTKNVLYWDSLTLVMVFWNLLTMLRFFTWIDFFIRSVSELSLIHI